MAHLRITHGPCFKSKIKSFYTRHFWNKCIRFWFPRYLKLWEEHGTSVNPPSADRRTDKQSDTISVAESVFCCCCLMSPTIKCIWVFMQGVRYYCPILTKFGLSRQIFVKVPNIKVHINPSSDSRADRCWQTDGQTDRHVESNRCFSLLSECAQTNTISSFVVRAQHHNLWGQQNERKRSGQNIKLPQDRYKMHIKSQHRYPKQRYHVEESEVNKTLRPKFILNTTDRFKLDRLFQHRTSSRAL